MRRKNIIAAIALLCLGAVYAYLTTLLPARSLPNTPPPSFFPWVGVTLLLGLSGVLLGQGLLAKPEPTSADGASPEAPRFDVLWIILAFLAYLICLPGLGFVLATIPFFGVMMWLFGERRFSRLAIGALCVPLILFVVFRHGFGVFLPRGLLAGVFG